MDNQDSKTLYTFIIFSENTSGVLNEITSVFARRQVNIESLNTSASSIEGLHRYTITCYGDELTMEKVSKQIAKKIGVVRSDYYVSSDVYTQEVALYKISTDKLLKHPEISRAVRHHSGSITEVNPTYAVVSMVGLTDEIVSLFQCLKQYDCVLQYVRSGAIAITRNKRELLNEYLDERQRRYEETEQRESHHD